MVLTLTVSRSSALKAPKTSSQSLAFLTHGIVLVLTLISLLARPGQFFALSTKTIYSSSGETRKVLGDGCYHVLIDAGSNRGVHGRFLFEPEKYPKSLFAKKFDSIFGTNRTKQNICVFAFEPNPFHNSTQSKTQSAYRNMGWMYTYMPYGVGAEDGQLSFYQNDFNNRNENWGFSISNFQQDSKETTRLDVNILDLSAWMEAQIFNRQLPAKTEYNTIEPAVVMKMDIEGSEYATLTHLLATGTAHKFQSIIGEWHSFTTVEIDGQNRTGQALRSMEGNLTTSLKEHDGPGFEVFDDEQYLHDGANYPTSPERDKSW